MSFLNQSKGEILMRQWYPKLSFDDDDDDEWDDEEDFDDDEDRDDDE